MGVAAFLTLGGLGLAAISFARSAFIILRFSFSGRSMNAASAVSSSSLLPPERSTAFPARSRGAIPPNYKATSACGVRNTSRTGPMQSARCGLRE
eukprot:scaffold91719_cov44-Phaeocystis_antarctica.AAC.1